MFLFSCMRKEYFKNLIHILCRGDGYGQQLEKDGNGKTEQEDAGLESAGRKNP